MRRFVQFLLVLAALTCLFKRIGWYEGRLDLSPISRQNIVRPDNSGRATGAYMAIVTRAKG